MTRFDCRDVEATGPELALGVLPGDERAAAYSHLEGCQACRANVSELGALVDEIVACGPTAEPPLGFEQRVLGRMLGVPKPARRRRRPLVAASLAIAAAIALLFVAVDGGPETRTAEAAMRTTSGAVVGDVVVRGDEDWATLTVAVPEWAEQVRRYDDVGRQYSVNVELIGGDAIVIPVDLATTATWEIPVDSGVESVTAVTLVDETGYTWCSATLRPR